MVLLLLPAVLLVTLIILLAILIQSSTKPVPWSQHIRRVRAGVRNQAEWMAPSSVVARVQSDYRAALGWLQDTAFEKPNPYRAATYLCEDALIRYRKVATQRHGDAVFVGVLRATNRLEVRRFSENGTRCLVLDHQTERVMATYDRATGRRVGTQALEDVVQVVAMAYDIQAGCWKIAEDVQRLPIRWADGATRDWYRTQVEPLANVGRDS